MLEDDRPVIGENHSWEEVADLLIEASKKGGYNAVVELPVVTQHYDDIRARIIASVGEDSLVIGLLDQMRREGRERIDLQNALKAEAELVMGRVRETLSNGKEPSDSDKVKLAEMQIRYEVDGRVVRWTVPPEFNDVVGKINRE